MRLGFVTLFPDWIRQAMGHSIMARAIAGSFVELQVANPRDFAADSRKTVDDRPYGGGPGMVLMAPVLDEALASLRPDRDAAIVCCDPAGLPFRQCDANALAQRPQVVLVCGHYEGIDERFIVRRCTHRFSIGDYVLTGGELPALVIADALVRRIPGVLGDPESLDADSHSDGLLGPPQFTKPETWDGMPVPEVLRSGNHAEIAAWRRREALRSTRERRPDLFAAAPLEKGDADMLSS